VALESGFYDVTNEAGTKYGSLEEELAKVDSEMSRLLKTIDEQNAPPPEGSAERTMLATGMALQLTRTPDQRERTLFVEKIVDFLAGRELTVDLVGDFLEEYLGFRPEEGEIRGATDYAQVIMQDPSVLTRTFALELMVGAIGEMVPYLLGKSWSLEIVTKGRLISSDTPVVAWKPPSEEDAYKGFGIADATEIRFALDAGKQLLLTREPIAPVMEIPPSRVRGCNADMTDACFAVLFGHPDHPDDLNRQTLRRRRPLLRFNTGPLIDEHGQDSGREVLHMWVPRK
jgi:hypothetical protein